MKTLWTSAALLAGLFVLAGCGQKTAENTGGDKKDKEVAKAGDKKDKEREKDKKDTVAVPVPVRER